MRCFYGVIILTPLNLNWALGEDQPSPRENLFKE